MESKSTSITARPRVICITLSMCKVIGLLAMAVQVRPVCAFFNGYDKIPQSQAREYQIYLSGLASRDVGYKELNNGVSELRINPNANECTRPFCTRCTARVSASQHYGEAMDCIDKDSNVKNSSCYLCNGECKTMGDLERKRHVPCGRLVEVGCCLLAQMGNLGHDCGKGGQYSCYKQGKQGKIQLKCQCPYGKKGERCQDSNSEMLSCRCYHPAYRFCGQGDIIDCDNRDRGPDVALCHMDVYRHGKQHNCVCNKIEDDRFGESVLDSCSNPRKDTRQTFWYY